MGACFASETVAAAAAVLVEEEDGENVKNADSPVILQSHLCVDRQMLVWGP